MASSWRTRYWVLPSIRPRHGAVEKRPTSLPTSTREGDLQFGHGTEPWRNQLSRIRCAVRHSPSIRPRHGAVEKPHAYAGFIPGLNEPSIRPRHGAVEKRTLRRQTAPGVTAFNSATARSRGETRRADTMCHPGQRPSIRPRHGAVEKQGPARHEYRRHGRLQFGHGTEPWRNGVRDGTCGKEPQPSIRPRHGAVEKPGPALDRANAIRPFNSATARSRGETKGSVGTLCLLPPFNSATARSRGETLTMPSGSAAPTPPLQFGHGTEPWRNTAQCGTIPRARALQFGHGTEPWRNFPHGPVSLPPPRGPSIRPRHGAVEKPDRSPATLKSSVSLQFGHGTEPWRNLHITGQTGSFKSPSIRPRHGAVEKPQQA